MKHGRAVLLTTVVLASLISGARSARAETIIDDSETGWTWSGMKEFDDPGLRGGTAHIGGPGTYGVYTFNGTGVDVYVLAGPSIMVDGRHQQMGYVKVLIDGNLKADEPTERSHYVYNLHIFTETGLPSGNHVLQLVPDDGYIAVDYIQVQTEPNSGLQDPQGTSSDSGGAASGGLGSDEPRALFIWTMVSGSIYASAANQADLFAFLAAPKGNRAHRIKTIFCAGMKLSDFSNSTSILQMQWFNSAAHQNGLTVVYLCGDPSFATTGKSAALQYVEAVLNYNTAATAEQKFDGFMYDVEPWSLPDWPNANVINGWIQMLTYAHAAIASSGLKLPLYQTLTWWLDDPRYWYCANIALDHIDVGVIADYTANTERFAESAENELSYASSAGKRVWIGVQTNGPADATTWFSHGNTAMEWCLASDLSFFQGHQAYCGYAIQDYVGYESLAP